MGMFSHCSKVLGFTLSSLNFFLLLVLSLISPLHAQEAFTLEGTWRFAMDREDAGLQEQWFNKKLTDQIELPGILQSQGYGDKISEHTPWVLGLGGEWWKLQDKSLKAAFSKPGHVEVPFLSQPKRHYLGAAWYQREIDLPAELEGNRFVLFLERPRWESTLWIDGRRIGSQRSLVAPHEYELNELSVGKHTITVRLDNRMIVTDPRGNNGHMPDAHAVSDALGSTWNGIAGKIELRSTPKIWLSDVQAFPRVADKSVLLEVHIGNLTGSEGNGKLLIAEQEYDVRWGAEGGEVKITQSLGEDAPTWDEFQPHLHRLKLVLESGEGRHTKEVTFGLREVTWKGKDLLVNDRSVNLRKTHFGLDFPLTGYPATDVASWEKIIRRCKEFGLNGIRFHSCCPPDAAFTAADKLGFYLQAECGLWAPFYREGVYTKYLEEETQLLLKAYGNHPCFILFSPSNEPAGRYTEVTPQWAERWYKRDPRRLYAAGTGWNRPEQVYGGAQFAGLVRFGRGELRNITGWFGSDFRTALIDVDIPVFAHEIGQWCAYPNFDVIEKFTGYLQPSNYRIFRYIAERNGVADLNEEFARASGKYQLACYKEELEANLRTPGLAGHQMLDIRDYLGQGTALIGVLDAFWDPKEYVTGKEFRRFHSQTVPLARLNQRIYTTEEHLQAEVEIYHYGQSEWAEARPYWKIIDSDGNILLEEHWETCDIPIGKCNRLGHIKTSLDQLPAPARYQLVVGLEDSEIENDWNFWLYPTETPSPEHASVLVCDSWMTAVNELKQGKTVLYTPKAEALDPSRSPRMRKTPIFWNIQMTVRPPRNPAPRFDAMLGILIDSEHPALVNFPTEKHCDWQWISIVNGVRSVNLTDAPSDLKPIVYAIDDWNRNWRLGVIFECQVGQGRLLVSTIPLDREDPVTKQLKASLLEYAAGEAQLPLTTLTSEQANSLWQGNDSEASSPDKRIFDPDLDDGTGPAASN